MKGLVTRRDEVHPGRASQWAATRAWPVAGALIGFAMAALPAAAEPAAGSLFSESPGGPDFVHFNGMSGELYFPEMMGSGAALFDYDGDGDLDAYLVQGVMLGPGKSLADAVFPPADDTLLADRLYRNDSTSEPGQTRIRFTDVTAASGLRADGYGMGVAAADFDNDGRVDLYVTNFGANQLWRNLGGGRFENVTAAAGVGDKRWSVSAAWIDYDRDGDLDLYVGNYVRYTFDNAKPCRSSTSARDYCSPLVYKPDVDTLYRNDGDGRFTDVSAAAGIRAHFGGALGVVVADFDGNGWQDLYVANDGVANQLWINRGDGTFSDEAMLAGVGVNMDGSPEASMGVDAADFDGDGDEDLFMTHLARETNTLYINDGEGWFEDRTLAMGLANPSFQYTGFGTAWFDYDNDGWLDILAVNGAVTRIEAQLLAGDPFPLRQTNQLFRNEGQGRYREVSGEAGKAFEVALVSRGAAFGDVDNDGDTDVLIVNNAGPARLLVNEVGQDAGWIGFRLADADRRDLYGAALVLDVGERTVLRRVGADGSYASSSDPRLLVGLGRRADAPLTAHVIWPDGKRERFDGLQPGRYHELLRGQGKPDGE